MSTLLPAHPHRTIAPDAGLRPPPLADARKPALQAIQIFGNRLAHIAELIDVAIKADVGDGEAVTREPRLVHRRIEPAHAGAGNLLLGVGLLGVALKPRFEEIERFPGIKSQKHRPA